ncbi:MAG: response regulator transcription factor [Dehalococcoidia bacterium]|nr:response regulator transcription factor [Dehalococcoidia bacterium]
MKLPVVLAIDDEEGILNFLRVRLRLEGYKAFTASNGEIGLQLAEANNPDLIILDLQMPEMDGYQFLQQLRAFSSVPVILLTAKEEDFYKIKGLELGADDYVTKPFNPDELCLRVKAILRRSRPAQGISDKIGPYQRGSVTIDFAARKVYVKQKDLRLSRTEWSLLEELARHAGRVLTHEQILTRVWGPEYRDDLEYLRVWVSRLRHKLEDDPNNPDLIQTLPRVGYTMTPASPTESP